MLQAQRLVAGFDTGEGCELVASETAGNATRPGPLAQAGADRGERGVPGRVPVAVVDA